MNMATMLASINDGPRVPASLEVGTEQIDITTATKTKPDTAWEYVDPSGHFHAFDKDGELPTLTSRSRHVDCDGSCGGACGDEGYETTYYFCSICDAPVEPVWITTLSVFREFMPGRTYWTVEVEQQITDDRVSVRLAAGDVEYFGVAKRGPGRAESGPDGVRAWTTLHGMSALGNRRTRTQAATASTDAK